jgi:hypothetical protein
MKIVNAYRIIYFKNLQNEMSCGVAVMSGPAITARGPQKLQTIIVKLTPSINRELCQTIWADATVTLRLVLCLLERDFKDDD